jgi:hypothetical protein
VSRVDELLDELRVNLRAAVSYSAASQVSDVYEGFLFSLVVDTARRSNAVTHYEDVGGNKTHNLVFRTTPGRIYSRAHDYTHAVVRFGSAPVLEVHVGVQVQGSSGAMHECDVVVLDADEAALCRRERTFPRVAKCLLAIECKYYTAHLPLGQARGFVGLSADMGNRAHSLFVANIASGSVTTYLTGRTNRKLFRELNVVPGVPEIDGVRGLIREAFKAHVGRGDSNFRI